MEGRRVMAKLYLFDNEGNFIPPIEITSVVHGKWVVVHDDVFADSYFCSVCREKPIVDLYGEYCLSNYCPFCGADMGERKENE